MSLRPSTARSATVICLALTLAWASAAQAHFVSPETLDLAPVLAGPPRLDSIAQQQDLRAVLEAQAARPAGPATPQPGSNDLTVFQFGDTLGPAFTPARLPVATAFFAKVQADVLAVLAPAKDRWKRPRPFVTSAEVRPAGEKPASTSYPSGNALIGYVYAVLLADILPERRDAIFAKGMDIGDARVRAGVHYPSDLVAGRQAAVAIVTALPQDRSYAAEFAAARAEIRAVLLQPQP